MRTTYLVSGMTCDHCVSHILEEISALPGVDQAELTLAEGRLVLDSTAGIDFDAVEQAVLEAGNYQVVPA
jgi:copper chaperone CopZ